MPRGLRLQFYLSMPLIARAVTLSIQKASLTEGFESTHKVPLIMAPSFSDTVCRVWSQPVNGRLLDPKKSTLKSKSIVFPNRRSLWVALTMAGSHGTMILIWLACFIAKTSWNVLSLRFLSLPQWIHSWAIFKAIGPFCSVDFFHNCHIKCSL